MIRCQSLLLVLNILLAHYALDGRKIKVATFESTIHADALVAFSTIPVGYDIRRSDSLVSAVFRATRPKIMLADFSFHDTRLMGIKSLPSLQFILFNENASSADAVITFSTLVVICLVFDVLFCANPADRHGGKETLRLRVSASYSLKAVIVRASLAMVEPYLLFLQLNFLHLFF